MKRVIVCGGRDYNEQRVVWGQLNELRASIGDFVLVEGGASGADHHAGMWATFHGVAHECWPAKWEMHGRAAGPLRNAAMLRAGADCVLAFPGGAGTADMKRRAKAAGVSVVEVAGTTGERCPHARRWMDNCITCERTGANREHLRNVVWRTKEELQALYPDPKKEKS